MDLAVKPQVIPHVAERVAGALKGKLLISIAAGVPIARLKALFGPMAIVRTMPNTPDLLGLGATAIVHGSLRRSYAEFYARSRRLASALAKNGIGRGDTVSVMLPNSPAMLECH